MAHWLSEAEKEQSGKKAYTTSAGFLDRKLRIEKNWAKNKDKYHRFINQMEDLVKRVNKLPLEKKDPFGNIDSKFKESKLENQQYIFRSSRRFERKLATKMIDRIINLDIFNILKPSHFKHMRVIYVTVSSKIDQVGIEFKEEVQLKQKIVVDKELVKDKKFFTDKNRIHEYLNLNMDDLNQDLAMNILDWLAFKIKTDQLRFYKG